MIYIINHDIYKQLLERNKKMLVTQQATNPEITENEVQMTLKPRKRCSASLIIGEMEIKRTMKPYDHFNGYRKDLTKFNT